MRINIICKHYYFLQYYVFRQHTWYKIVFVLRRELVTMFSRAQIITGVHGFREQLPQRTWWLWGCDGCEVVMALKGLSSASLAMSARGWASPGRNLRLRSRWTSLCACLPAWVHAFVHWCLVTCLQACL